MSKTQTSNAIKKPFKLRRFLDEHQPPITGVQMAAACGVGQPFMSDVLNGRKKLPVRHLPALTGLGIPPKLLITVITSG